MNERKSKYRYLSAPCSGQEIRSFCFENREGLGVVVVREISIDHECYLDRGDLSFAETLLFGSFGLPSHLGERGKQWEEMKLQREESARGRALKQVKRGSKLSGRFLKIYGVLFLFGGCSALAGFNFLSFNRNNDSSGPICYKKSM